MKHKFGFFVFVVLSSAGLASTKNCETKAESLYLANAVVEPMLRTSSLKYDYSESSTVVGEGTKVATEEYTYIVNEISSATVALIKNSCQLLKFEVNLGE